MQLVKLQARRRREESKRDHSRDEYIVVDEVRGDAAWLGNTTMFLFFVYRRLQFKIEFSCQRKKKKKVDELALRFGLGSVVRATAMLSIVAGQSFQHKQTTNLLFLKK